ncbi:Uncharacterized protein FWK35_00006942 [Aphis craccivora]|uniref:Uncharacterized protein n=1 Tax=Aphis craccivora TaxID=307492 RepID=A0A6G0ZF47_APHCR|nr:Uncharacterized protein FWK35_00006942 [Aphis craccivora]
MRRCDPDIRRRRRRRRRRRLRESQTARSSRLRNTCPFVSSVRPPSAFHRYTLYPRTTGLSSSLMRILSY